MSYVLIVDDMVLIRDLLESSLRSAGYETACAADGQQALAAIQTRKPDVILLDLRMPVMDGLAVLESLRAGPRTAKIPVVLMTAAGDKNSVVKAAACGVKDYILKSNFSEEELLARVRKYTAAPQVVPDGRTLPTTSGSQPSEVATQVPARQVTVPSAPAARIAGQIPSLLTREQCIERAEQAMYARTLSGAVLQVITMAASPRGDMSELASLVARDPVLSVRILQAANSVSYMSTRGMVSTIPEAVRNIGCAGVRDIAAALGVFDAMPPSGPDGFNPIRCWQHSFAVATLCQRLSSESGGGLAYLVGLCHDLGEVLFQTHFGTEYGQVLEVQRATGKRRDEIERAMLGMSHGTLVQTILRCLSLPNAICEPIEDHHRAGVGGRATTPAGRLLSVADLYANGVLLASSPNSPVAPLTRPDCRAATAQDSPPPPDAESLRAEIYCMTAMLARLSAKDEASMMTALYPKRRARLTLVRDASLSSFDPVQAALESMVELQVFQSIPATADLVGHHGLVVLSRSTSAGGLTATEVTSASRTVPVLWLVGRVDEGTLPPGSTMPVVWPVPLSLLGEFVQQVFRTANSAPQAA